MVMERTGERPKAERYIPSSFIIYNFMYLDLIICTAHMHIFIFDFIENLDGFFFMGN